MASPIALAGVFKQRDGRSAIWIAQQRKALRQVEVTNPRVVNISAFNSQPQESEY